MEKAMTYFLDFDRTLFDTDSFLVYLGERLEIAPLLSLSREERSRVLGEALTEGRITFAPGELSQFVYADVPEFLRAAGNEAVIVTYGDETIQKAKIESAFAGIPRISALYIGFTHKGEFLKERYLRYGSSPVFTDDLPSELEGVTAYCPSMKLYEMRRDGKEGDGRWPVIRSLSDLP